MFYLRKPPNNVESLGCFYHFQLFYEIINVLIHPAVLFRCSVFIHVAVANPVQINDCNIIQLLFWFWWQHTIVFWNSKTINLMLPTPFFQNGIRDSINGSFFQLFTPEKRTHSTCYGCVCIGGYAFECIGAYLRFCLLIHFFFQ